MESSRRKTFALLTLGTLLALGGSHALAGGPAAAEPPCEVMRAWASQNATRIAVSAEEFARYPDVVQRYVFAELDPDTKSNLIRAHYLFQLSSHSDWTSAQRSVLTRAMAFASPETYFVPLSKRAPDDPVLTVHADLVRAAEHAFTEEARRTLFYRLSSPEMGGPSYGMEVLPASLTSGGSNSLFVGVQPPGICNCREGEGECAPWQICDSGCHPTGSGCGWGGADVCDGECKTF